MSTENTPTDADEHADQDESTAAGERPDEDDPERAGTDGSDPKPAGADGDRDERGSDGRSLVTLLEWGAVAALGLVALVAVFRFYFAASRAIGIWITPDFEPLFQAAFNLVVLLCAATGIVFFARRLR